MSLAVVVARGKASFHALHALSISCGTSTRLVRPQGLFCDPNTSLCSGPSGQSAPSWRTLSSKLVNIVEEELDETPPLGKSIATPPAAFFDVDGTIVKSNVVSAFLTWRVFYRSYAGRHVSKKEEAASIIYERYLEPNIFPGAVERIRALKRGGCRIVLITGSLDFLVAPLAASIGADAVFAARLKEEDGIFTGELEGEAVSSAEKAKVVRQYAEEHDLFLPDCHAYGDSFADLEMLMQVGYPFAVRPDPRLQEIATERGWKCIRWQEGEEL